MLLLLDNTCSPIYSDKLHGLYYASNKFLSNWLLLEAISTTSYNTLPTIAAFVCLHKSILWGAPIVGCLVSTRRI